MVAPFTLAAQVAPHISAAWDEEAAPIDAVTMFAPFTSAAQVAPINSKFDTTNLSTHDDLQITMIDANRSIG